MKLFTKGSSPLLVVALSVAMLLLAGCSTESTSPVAGLQEVEYEDFEIEQHIALRDDSVILLAGINKPSYANYVGIVGGIGAKSTQNIMPIASNGTNTLNWPTPGIATAVHCKLLGKYDHTTDNSDKIIETQVWGIIIPRANFTTYNSDSSTDSFSWKFFCKEGWDEMLSGVAPFINPADFNNCLARLNYIPTPTGTTGEFAVNDPTNDLFYQLSDYAGAIVP